MSTSVALSTSSSSWRNVLAQLVCTISQRMQKFICDDGLFMLHRSKWRCLASTYSSDIQDLIELVKPEYEQMSLCNNFARPLQAFQQAVQDGWASMQAYIPRLSEGSYHSWLVDKALKLGMSTDVVDVHLHDFLWASSTLREQVFRITGRHKDLEAHLLEQARKLHEIWSKEDADADLRSAKGFLIQLKGEYRDNDETCQLADFILSKLSHIEEASHNHVTLGPLPPYMCIHTDQCLQTNTEGIFRNDHTEVRKVMWLGGRFVLKSFKHMDEDDYFFKEGAAIDDLSNTEAAIQARVWHPHVVPLVCRTSKPPGLLMELMQENLADLIKRRRSRKNESLFPLLMAVDLMLQIAKGMEYLHSDTLCIIHRDLKPANILVSSPNVNSSTHAGLIPQVHLKIADFGVSKAKLECSVYTTRDQGTTPWMSPEVYGEFGGSDESKYSNKADVYSFGIVCSEILTGNPPFIGQRSTIRKRVLQGERPPLPQHCPPALSNFIQMCWHADPTKRPTFIQICRVLRYFKACILLADCDEEAWLLLSPYISTAHIDGMVDHSLTGRTFQPKALGIPLEMYFYGIHFGFPSTCQNIGRAEQKGSPENNGFLTNGEVQTTRESPVVEQSEAEQRQQKLLTVDRQQEDLDALLKCVTQDVGFSRGRPVAACIIYKSLLQWRSFEAETTNVFDGIIRTIGTAIESQENNENILAYWLTNTSMILFLLQRTLKVSSAGGPQRRRAASVSLFGRMTQGFRSSPAGGGGSSFGDGVVIGGLDSPPVKAKSSTLLFKQQITEYVEKIYGMIRDNLKQEIRPLLAGCIQAPRTSRVGLVHALSTKQQILSTSQWHSIIKSLSNLLSTMRANHVSAFFVRKVFTQIFSYINVQLFNSLLLRRECCSFSNGEYLKMGLAALELWVCEASEEYAGSAWDKLKHFRQAVGFLVIHQKRRISLDEITHDLCPVLSIQQLYRISTIYWDDEYGTQSVSPEVIANMRVLMTEDTSNVNSFLLDDDSSIPFSVHDISKLMTETDFSDVDPPPMLRENPDFFFLQPQAA